MDNKDFIQYCESISEYEMLSEEEERKLAIRKDRGDKDAQDALVCSHLYLVTKIAREYYSDTLSLMDLVQAGNEGLIIAVQKFDITKGTRLSTFAAFYIRRKILEAVYSDVSLLSMPEKIAKELVNQKNDITEINKYKDFVSIEESEQILNIKSDESEYSSKVEDSEVTDAIKDVLSDFGETERVVIEMLYGLGRKESLSESETAKLLNLKVSEIRRIREKILRKLKSPKNKRKLKDYI